MQWNQRFITNNILLPGDSYTRDCSREQTRRFIKEQTWMWADPPGCFRQFLNDALNTGK